MTCGYVHEYTRNFYDRLRPDDYVLKFESNSKELNRGYISYIHKSEVKTDDVLGKNIASFRQWRLSEINLSGDSIKVAKCSYKTSCVCPQVVQTSTNPFKKEIPIWSRFNRDGYFSLDNFNKLGKNDGGTVVIIWEIISADSVLFMDLHGSLQEIINTAREIASQYKVDPTIAIGDAAPFAQKFRSNKNHNLKTLDINKLSKYPYAGAGFGYVPIRETVFEITYSNGEIKTATVSNNSNHYQELLERVTE